MFLETRDTRKPFHLSFFEQFYETHTKLSSERKNVHLHAKCYTHGKFEMGYIGVTSFTFLMKLDIIM